MKKMIATVLVLLTVFSLCSCTQKSGGYKLLDIPDALTINAEEFSEDLDTALLNMDESYPLLCAIPEKQAYVYAVHPTVMQGVLVKYQGNIQYFPWDLIPELCKPEMYMADYNGDGEEDLAITFVENAAGECYNETLHILLDTGNRLEDYIYSAETAAADAQNHLVVEQKGDNDFEVFLDGKKQKFTLNGYGELLGLYTEDAQDFTLGETITLTVGCELVFKDTQLPVSAFKYSTPVILQDGVYVHKEPVILF